MDASFRQLLLDDTVTRLVFFPTAAALPLVFARFLSARAVKGYALVVSVAYLGLAALFAWSHWDAAGMLAADPVLPWFSLPGLEVGYEVGIDGVSLPLVLLTALLLPVVVLGSWKGIETSWAGYAASLLVLTTGIVGALVALDLFLFYVFWEVMLVPMYFVIGIWGGERRVRAAVKFFLFTMGGSLVMLVGILWLGRAHFQATGSWSFRYEDLLALALPAEAQFWLFAAFALAFAVKVPMFPFHTWLPDAHVEAPTGGSVILAGILLKLGTYGFLRFALPLFPHGAAELAPWLLAAALVGILYGALVSWVQPDMKKLVAYSSIAHLGFVMLGIVACDLVAWQGALLQMVNHGLSTGALFLLVGMLYDRRHTKRFDEFGGLAKVIPRYAVILAVTALASVGLPALNGFVGEFLILAGSWRAGLRLATALAAFGVVLAALYLLRMLRETIWGALTKKENEQLADLDLRELSALLPLVLFMVWIGVAPNPFLAASRPALADLLASYEQRLAAPAPEAIGYAPPGGPGGRAFAVPARASQRAGR
jgi:NADH-quinone oxidoreductase subunit M